MSGSTEKTKTSGSAFIISGKILRKFKKKADPVIPSAEEPMKVAVFGASGPTGQYILSECLEKGYDVLAFVRNTSKIKVESDKLQVIKADVFNEDELVTHLTGRDVIFSALGATGLSIFSKVTLYLDSIKSITAAMRKTSVSRIICLTSWYTESEADSPKVFQWFVKPFLMGRVLVSMAEMEKYLETECNDINYTVVRPAMLGNGPSTGEEIKAVEGQFVPESTGKIKRHDVAKFMIGCTSTEEWDRKAVAIGV